MKDKIIIESNEKPKVIRDWIAWKLVWLANWIRPGNKAALDYYMGIVQESMLEEMLYGRSELEIKVRKHKQPFTK